MCPITHNVSVEFKSVYCQLQSHGINTAVLFQLQYHLYKRGDENRSLSKFNADFFYLSLIDV